MTASCEGKNSEVRVLAGLSARGFEEFRRDLRYWTVPAVHLIVELLHFAIGELAGEFGERGFEAGDGAQAIGAGGDADFIGWKGVPVVGQDLQVEAGEQTVGRVGGDDIHLLLLQRLDRKSTRLNSSHIPLSRMPF